MPQFLFTAVDAVQYLTHPISFIAYVIAVAFSYLSFKTNNQRKQINSASEKDRANVIIQTAETLHIDLSNLPQKDRKEVVLAELRNRIRNKLITAVVVIMLGFFVTYLVTRQIESANQTASKEESIKNKPTEQPRDQITYKEAFGINYMRLFGSEAVPGMMEIIEGKGINKSKSHEGYYVKNKKDLTHDHPEMREDESYVSPALGDFWINQWTYKNALPLKTKLWVQFSGKTDAGKELYWTTLSPNIEDLFAYTDYHSEISWSDNPDVPKKIMNEMIETERKFKAKNGSSVPIYESGVQANDVGYLFLILTNTSDEELLNVGLVARTFKNPLKIQHENYLDYKNKPEPGSLALKDEDLRVTGEAVMDTLHLASMKQNSSIIWVLCAYRKKSDGLPQFYLTDVNVPEKILFRHAGNTFYDTIRKPYGEKAARLTVPAGWFSQ